MLKHILYFSLFLALFLACSEVKSNKETQEGEPVQQKVSQMSEPEHQQVVLVSIPDWNAVEGRLMRYEWEGGVWQAQDEGWPIVVGKAGMAWGKGMREFPDAEGPQKVEGDKRSPAGVFILGAAFGYADKPDWLEGPYVHVIPSTMCIEDGESQFYNQIIDEKEESADWNSTDHMLRKDDLYEWGVFVAHNSPEAESGKGSCIFLHVWRRNDSGTAGCTAMDKSRMKELVAWLKPQKRPILLQMPEKAQELNELKRELNLPSL
ncbi:MAG: L,D-transpeptidase family protein [Bacteroidota bacterium]